MPKEESFPLCGACFGEGFEQDLSVVWKCTCRKNLLDLHQPVKGSLNISVDIRPILVEFLLGFGGFFVQNGWSWFSLWVPGLKKTYPEPWFVGSS